MSMRLATVAHLRLAIAKVSDSFAVTRASLTPLLRQVISLLLIRVNQAGLLGAYGHILLRCALCESRCLDRSQRPVQGRRTLPALARRAAAARAVEPVVQRAARQGKQQVALGAPEARVKWAARRGLHRCQELLQRRRRQLLRHLRRCRLTHRAPVRQKAAPWAARNDEKLRLVTALQQLQLNRNRQPWKMRCVWSTRWFHRRTNRRCRATHEHRLLSQRRDLFRLLSLLKRQLSHAQPWIPLAQVMQLGYLMPSSKSAWRLLCVPWLRRCATAFAICT